MTALGIFGAALLYGDGVITPAISVLSSVEGLTLLSPVFSKLTVPLTIGIMVGLFAIQKKLGSGSVGKVFGAVMLVWFGALAIMGAAQVLRHPEILRAMNPYIGGHYLLLHRATAIVVLGSVFLAVTGGEALYADLGHFGRRPIQLAWNFLVLPALALNYCGQGALVIAHPEGAEKSVLFAGSGLGAAAARHSFRDGRDGDRVAGAHLGRLFADDASDPHGLSAAHECVAYQ